MESDLCTTHVHLCLTLSQFAANSIDDVNITLIILPGNHSLFVNLSLSNLTNLLVYSNFSATVVCESSSHFSFESIEFAYIRNLNFIGCGGNSVEYVHEFQLQESKFEGQVETGTSVRLIKTTAEIVDCAFKSNQFGTIQNSVKSVILLSTDVVWLIVRNVTGNVRVGGAVISIHSNIRISQCKFENNTAEIGGDIFTEEFSKITIFNSTFTGDASGAGKRSSFGGSIFSDESDILISECQLNDNYATVGGAIASSLSNFTIDRSTFFLNSAYDHGGVLFAYNSSIAVNDSNFEHNIAGGGGAVNMYEGTIDITTSRFISNIAERHAGALDLYRGTSNIKACLFKNNSAYSFGGAVLFWFSSSNMYGTKVTDAEVQASDVNTTYCYSMNKCDGATVGANNTSMFASDNEIHFISNNAPIGAAYYAIRSTVISCGRVFFSNNAASLYSFVYFLDSDGYFVGSTVMSQNLGSFLAFNSNITFSGCTKFVNCSPPQNTSANFKEGGALTLFQSTLTFQGMCRLENNHAEIGGAIVGTESKLYLNDEVTITNNKAAKSGGGLYLSQSELNSLQESNVTISGNNAVERGGGVHAVSSSVKCIVTGSKYTDKGGKMIDKYMGALLNIIHNTAQKGGALFLEANSKVTLLKDYIFVTLTNHSAVKFIGNTADYGGAVYVDDELNSGSCASNPFVINSPKSECFFRVVATHAFLTANTNFSLNNVLFHLNSAIISGSILFGGLLDRCTVSLFNEVDRTLDLATNSFLTYQGDGLQYLLDISTGHNEQSISSYPVQLCLCTNDHQNCGYKVQNNITVRKGYSFNLSLIAVDQVYNPLNATIQGYLHSTGSDLIKGQVTRITDRCANLSFKIVSPYRSEELTLFASDGPCKDAELSRMKVGVTFLPCTCPVGFVPSEAQSMACECVCNPKINPYVVECNATTKSFQRRINVWISYINHTDSANIGYLVYIYCPFDYCVPPNISAPVNLNLPNGADAQCALNHTGLLCGACKPGLSLSLGSSKCLKCPDYWPVLFVVITTVAIIAGIGLVVLFLWLNLTVAVGTMNGLLFYANIVAANRVVLLPYPEPNFITIFMSWLNLELGIDVCYIEGMDIYIKTWLQLAFPTYIITLVLLLIIVSRYSSRFSKLIAKRNPVAALATLILLSYGKLFHVVLMAQPFTFASLSYPNGSRELVWLPDGTVKYITGKHIVLFVAALLILFICIAYSLLLFCWQLILRCLDWKIFACVRSPTLYFFMETYHVPYTPRHRYWTGLLLLARAILYLIAAANVSGNPQIQLVSIIFIVSCIILLKMFIATKIFKKWLIDTLESFFYFNIVFFASFTAYNLSTGSIQDGIAYTSVVLSFTVTLFIILYHIHEYTSLLSRLCHIKIMKNITKSFKMDQKQNVEYPHTPDRLSDMSRLDDILDIGDCPTSDADCESHSTPFGPTCSVVELSY